MTYLVRLDRLRERFPRIGFLLQFEFQADSKLINASELDEAAYDLNALHDVELLYVYGVSAAAHYAIFKAWLDVKVGRAVIFLEDQLEAFHHLLCCESADELLTDSRIHCILLPEQGSAEQEIEELVRQFPSDRLECMASLHYLKHKKRRFHLLQSQILKAASLFAALYAEVIYADRLFANLLPNFQRMPQAFDAAKLKNAFSGMPAIVCGAGPSLQHEAEILKNLSDRALFLACGSAGAALTYLNIPFHLAVAADPNREELERLRKNGCFDAPLFYASRLYPGVFAALSAPTVYMRTDTGGLIEKWLEDRLQLTGDVIGEDLTKEAFSATTLGVSMAHFLGCDPIILVGVDLAYIQSAHYAPGVVGSAPKEGIEAGDKRIVKKRGKKKIITNTKWLMESRCLSAFAKAHAERRFWHTSALGLGFKHIPVTSLASLWPSCFQEQRDLTAELHAFLQSAKLPIAEQDLHKALLAMQTSIVQSLNLVGRLETGQLAKLTLLYEDLTAQPAFEIWIEPLLFALKPLLMRYYPKHTDEERENYAWQEVKRLLLNLEKICTRSLAPIAGEFIAQRS